MDPRDRNAVVSGVIGIIVLFAVTGAIMVRMWKHFELSRRGEFSLADDADMEDLKEPLHAGRVDNNRSDSSEYEDVPATITAAAPPV
jgi:hypothetical protein